MKGKEKCKALKEIRSKIAQENDIAFAVSECTHQGDCKGTCPKCEAELRYLERELARKQALGKAVAVAGIAMSVCAGMTACSPQSLGSGFGVDSYAGGMEEPPAVASTEEVLMGEVAYYPEDSESNEGSPEESCSEGTDCSQESYIIEELEGDVAFAPEESDNPELYEGGLEMIDPEDAEDAVDAAESAVEDNAEDSTAQ